MYQDQQMHLIQSELLVLFLAKNKQHSILKNSAPSSGDGHGLQLFRALPSYPVGQQLPHQETNS